MATRAKQEKRKGEELDEGNQKKTTKREKVLQKDAKNGTNKKQKVEKDETDIVVDDQTQEDEEVVFKAVSKLYKIGKLLGEGSFGKVYEGSSIKTGDKVALKFVDMSNLTFSDRPDSLKDEIRVMLKLDHKNVIDLIDIMNYWKGWMVIAMELCTGGTLIHDLVESTKRGLDEARARRIFVQILNGVNYLHSNNICHRDLNGANILMKEKDKDIIKIVDFGSARLLTPADSTTTFGGAEPIRAPEVTEEGNPYDATKADCWSIGCVLYKMLTNKWPFVSQVQAISSAGKDLRFPSNISPEAREVVYNLLNINPALRWSCEDVLKSAWIKDMDDEVQWLDEPNKVKKLDRAEAERQVDKATSDGCCIC